MPGEKKGNSSSSAPAKGKKESEKQTKAEPAKPAAAAAATAATEQKEQKEQKQTKEANKAPEQASAPAATAVPAKAIKSVKALKPSKPPTPPPKEADDDGDEADEADEADDQEKQEEQEQGQEKDEQEQQQKQPTKPAEQNTGSRTEKPKPTKKPDDYFEVRMLVDNRQVGAIIGKEGANVKRVRNETGVSVSVLKSQFASASERVVLLTGSVQPLATAVGQLAQLLNSPPLQKSGKEPAKETTNEESRDVRLRLLAHQSVVGSVIGKAGALSKQTLTETGVRVSVSKECLPGSTDKTITLSGAPDAILAAAKIVLGQLSSNPLRPGTPILQYVPTHHYSFFNQPQPPFAQQQPQPWIGAYGGYGANVPYQPYPGRQPYPSRGGGNNRTPSTARGGNSGAASPLSGKQGRNNNNTNSNGATGGGSTRQKIAIPTVCAGCVIGRGGSVIRDVRMRSGCTINIADADEANPTERIVTIEGSSVGISQAIMLIRHLVEQYQPPRRS